MHRRAAQGFEVLICAPFGRDAESMRELLAQEQYRATVCADLTTLSERVTGEAGESVGLILVTQEALEPGFDTLAAALRTQPDWSDIPIMVLAARRTGRSDAIVGLRHRLPETVTNVMILERPLGIESLVSSIASAMRARQKQFEMRDRLRELTASREALAASERELRLVTDSLPVLIAFVDRDLVYRFANRAYEDWFGTRADTVIGRTIPEVLGPDTFETRREAVRRALAGEPALFEAQLAMPGRADRLSEIRYLPRRDAAGRVDGFHIFVLDVTAQKRMENELREAAASLEARVAERTEALRDEMARREGAEEALRQSQKMEAIGQLTGGIAHDFNNMLAGVIGSLDLMRRRIDTGDMEALERYRSNAMQAAQRAATLTARLLAFGRRQSLDLKALDLNTVVEGMEDLLRRTLGENIEIETRLCPEPLVARTDVSQLENSLLNLAINARDAMPDGGRLTITARRATDAETRAAARPGPFAALEVADTGSGMSPETLAKAFEPFFTTKPLGQGTGLGLSQIYGFARQSGGHVAIDSREGEGTSIRLLLPAEAGTVAVESAVATGEVPAGEGETVLVVEDEGLVRMLIVDVLGDLGYQPLEAVDAAMALPMLESSARIDLLVTDVGLPGMNGRQLAEIARRLRPELKILFVTGYAESASVRGEFLGENMDLIAKPFEYEALGAKVREMILGRPAG
ncbi:hybrid sensor histidine kinase/response regulator [Aureimonas phyllosphaerae]|uniref:histidine kinase n=1 Tax=Aureimonas phyllosphaerae TaxID=1166078 RepID=A0A7W6C0N7_9HYPH|nr:PAS domain-containing sensor histidine kinase [Aureimonas phyllosphaerae]MBB3936267.1 PAS domain S-box-containing protein [Aureimonas phyllosphaerae]MBB3960008.1 PAS domain S-box-containing protein [Aureimonas phyllosphaerae]SFF47521.1 PAS/PAC sensor hybrid histidine kinase [Aureimonas phyllosphaerae]